MQKAVLEAGELIQCPRPLRDVLTRRDHGVAKNLTSIELSDIPCDCTYPPSNKHGSGQPLFVEEGGLSGAMPSLMYFPFCVVLGGLPVRQKHGHGSSDVFGDRNSSGPELRWSGGDFKHIRGRRQHLDLWFVLPNSCLGADSSTIYSVQESLRKPLLVALRT